MIHSTQIARLDGLMLLASMENAEVISAFFWLQMQYRSLHGLHKIKDGDFPIIQITGDPIPLSEHAVTKERQWSSKMDSLRNEIRQIIKKLGPNSEPRASIESGDYTMHYLMKNDLAFFAVTERSYPTKLASTYLQDIADEFFTNYQQEAYLDPSLRPYAFSEFERYIERTKKTYQDARATDNLSKLNNELKDVAQVMTKNIEDLLYRGDSLEKMGDMSSRLREDSAKYKRAAVRINWELLLKQYGPIAAGALFFLFFLYFMVRKLF